MALWARKTMNTDWSNGPLARPFARSLAPLTHSLAPHYSLAHFAHSRAHGTVFDYMTIFSVFFSILAHSALEETFLKAKSGFLTPKGDFLVTVWMEISVKAGGRK